MSRVARAHADWRALVEPTEPFLTLPVLKRVFPNGLPPAGAAARAEARGRLAQTDLKDPVQQAAWIEWVLRTLLSHGKFVRMGDSVPADVCLVLAEHGVVLRPDAVVVGPRAPGDPDSAVRLIVVAVPPSEAIIERSGTDRWAASRVERARLLARAVGAELAVVTDGDRWVLAWAPQNKTGGHATFTASLFGTEAELLDAFVAVLGARRLFGVAKGDHLEALFHESAAAEEDVTNQLGEQVRSAVEILVHALSHADREREGELLRGVDASEVYDASLTVLMRLVFLFAAEERGLLPLGDDFYDRGYAVSTLREQLHEEANLLGDETLEHRHSAWFRMLALTRAVHGGIAYDDLRIPAYGGGLFDPDRYPFLEGRRPGQAWTDNEAAPIPIDDRTLLEILDRLQVLRFRQSGVTEARTLSYRSLSVEQIGHVYEGLLDHSAVRAADVVLGLVGAKGLEPEIALGTLEDWAAQGSTHYLKQLAEWTGRGVSQLRKQLEAEPDEQRERLLRIVAEGRKDVYERVLPHLPLVRNDVRDLPTLILPGSIYVTATTARRETGTAYTTRDLADEVARYALEPLVYSPGPAEEKDPAKWTLRSPDEILALHVCDPAVGSGAIIVAGCRYLADRLVEAWTAVREAGGEPRLGTDPIWTEDAEELSLIARRAVADRCIFGVDRNAMAVEMAKMSLWLVTMAKERPFTFLDHAFKVGDSLLGLTNIEQLATLHTDPVRGREVHAAGSLFSERHFSDFLRPRVEHAAESRRVLETVVARTVRDVEAKAQWNHEAEAEVETLTVIADVVVGAALSTAEGADDALDQRLAHIAPIVAAAIDPDASEENGSAALLQLRRLASEWLDTGRPEGAPRRAPLHWPLAFPEVFAGGGNFDAMIGNPPFLGGHRISGSIGNAYRTYLVKVVAGGRRGAADLSAYFFLRAAEMTRFFGLLATNSIAQGNTREVGLDHLVDAQAWNIYRAVRSTPWPGEASLEIAKVWASARGWRGMFTLNNEVVARGITPMLYPRRRVEGMPFPLAENANIAFEGVKVTGLGFLLEQEEAAELLAAEPKNHHVVMPYLIGEDLTGRPDLSASRWIINFRTWPLDAVRNYARCFAILEQRVKPERQTNAVKALREKWWQFARPRPEMHAAIDGQEQVIVLSKVSKAVMPVLVPTGQVFAHRLAVFAYDDYAHLAILSSAFHWWWAVFYSATLESRVNYTASVVFDSFPQPAITQRLSSAGTLLHEYRAAFMSAHKLGLTDTYNLLDDPTVLDSDVNRLREIHVEVDEAVKAAYEQADSGYQWASLKLGHGFRETRQGVRWTVSELAEREIMDRLLELNFERHEQQARSAPARRTRKGSAGSQTALAFGGAEDE